MRTYIAVVDKDRDTAFGLWFPDVPGCFAAADDQKDIVRNAIEALTLHLEGQELPAARGVDDLAQDAEVARALRANQNGGAYLLGVPFVVSAHRSVRANISIDKGTLDAIDAAADQRGLTRSAFIAEATLNEIRGR